ncbi:MAG TPA: hypothetical protein VFC53_07575 [Dehalococcoidia bacterium]|nr:hypothetical protein [Dehalococcoidia bacterium]
MPTTKKGSAARRAASTDGAGVARRAAPAKGGRVTPRPFAFHWGGGNIIEEASFRGQYTEPSIQLLEYEGHAGSYGVRFCYYSLDGRFQRSPMMIDGEENLEGLRAALKTTPKLRALLKRLVS